MPDTNHFDEDAMCSLERDSRAIAIFGPILAGFLVAFAIGCLSVAICHRP